jgi:opacity protein-like surface antigen
MKAALAAALLVVGVAAPARADITGFLGANTTPANRAVRGAAIGAGLLIVGFEVEYAYTPDDPSANAPALTTGSGNALLQTPFEIFGFQPYVTGGVGFFRETLGLHQETNLAVNTGAGIKLTLAGPLRLRVDYRVFKLGGDALASPAHRIYAGLNVKF